MGSPEQQQQQQQQQQAQQMRREVQGLCGECGERPAIGYQWATTPEDQVLCWTCRADRVANWPDE